jgi:hypothetical protein
MLCQRLLAPLEPPLAPLETSVMKRTLTLAFARFSPVPERFPPRFKALSTCFPLTQSVFLAVPTIVFATAAADTSLARTQRPFALNAARAFSSIGGTSGEDRWYGTERAPFVLCFGGRGRRMGSWSRLSVADGVGLGRGICNSALLWLRGWSCRDHQV